MNIRTGFGYDVHAFAEGRELWLGGVRIDWPLGLAGHSDADVLIHAVCDALLGAACLRDIGYHFPDTSDEYRGIDSKILLARTTALLRNAGYEPGNVDATVAAEQPKLNPYIPHMQQTLAGIMQIAPEDISIKATTTEKLGFTGRCEGIAAYAAVLISRNSGGGDLRLL
ncbi:MAG: 2-C-methyl-D-erythritol 2,4-cyclodiphosphate synthase [Tannerella sp.]|jgi:2-C-methyl-D-erythritol 2,4-cyclodiphosphate synthase|nr:2-C-methyl-D-erythritol 2,4-cyclodiphosphate synthase [Tannerella sp.]